jgi:ATP-dependent RNA helicase HelY
MEVAAADVGEIAPGDFVRSVKQLADLAGQVAMVAEDDAIARSCRQSVDALLRNVVVAGGSVASTANPPFDL